MGVSDPATLRGTQFWAHFHSDGSNNDWGFKAYIFPTVDKLAEWAGDMGEFVESVHPYADNSNETWTVNMPGAAGLEICFDPASCTEANYDYVQFFNEDETEQFGAQKYSGGRGGSNKNFPTMEDSLLVRGDTLIVKFISDGSNNDWGFRLCVRPVDESRLPAAPEDPFADFMAADDARHKIMDIKKFFARTLFYATMDADAGGAARTIDTKHPYDNNTNQLYTVSYPGAISIAVSFDPQTVTERRWDWIAFYEEDEALTIRQVEINKQRVEAKFSGNFADGGYGDFTIPSDSVVSRFFSDGSNNAWGVRFTVKPEFPKFDFDGVTFQNALMGAEGFELLKDLALADQANADTDAKAISRYAGMALGNVLCNEHLKLSMLADVSWATTLMQSAHEDVQLSIVKGLLGDAAASGGTLSDELKQTISDNNMLPMFVNMAVQDNPELQAVSLKVLAACLGTESATVEDALLAVLTLEDDSLYAMALQNMAEFADKGEQQRERVVELGGINKIKPLIVSGDDALAQQAAATLIKLITTEDTVADFLDGGGGDLVLQLLQSGDAARRHGGLKLAKALVTKQPCPQAFELCGQGGEAGDGGFRQIIDRSLQLSASDIGVVVGLADQLEAAEQLTKRERMRRKKAEEARTENEHFMSFSAWVRLDDMPVHDGVPLFVKGTPPALIKNTSAVTQTFRANLAITSGRVYYEVSLKTAGALFFGWAAPDFKPQKDGEGTTFLGDRASSKAYGASLADRELAWGGWQESTSSSKKQNFGTQRWAADDVIGVGLDLDSGNMRFYVDGEDQGTAFTLSEHGPNSSFKPPGPEWSNGFHAAMSVPPNESFAINWGDITPCQHMPPGYQSVAEALGRTPELTVAKDITDEGCTWAAVPTGKGGFFAPAPSDVNNMSLSITRSLQLQLKLPLVPDPDAPSVVQPSTYLSKAMIVPQQWTHICVSIDNDSVDMYVNGEMDNQWDLDVDVYESPEFVAIGKADSGFTPSGDWRVWIEDMRWSHHFLMEEEVAQRMHKAPRHVNFLHVLAEVAQHAAPQLMDEFCHFVARGCGEEECDNQGEAWQLADDVLDLFNELSTTDAAVWTRTLDDDAWAGIVGSLLRTIERGATTDQQTSAARTLTLLADLRPARRQAILQDGVRFLIASCDFHSRAWCELALCKMVLQHPHLEMGSDWPHSKEEQEKLLYFTQPVTPFPEDLSTQTLSRALPTAIYAMAKDVGAFARIAHSIARPLAATGSVDSISRLPEGADHKLLNWCVSTFSMLTLDPSRAQGGATGKTFETRTHPYDNSEDYGDQLSFPRAIKVVIEFDPQSVTERNYDYLTLFDADPAENSGLEPVFKLSGGHDQWPKKPIVLNTDTVFWKWHSDGSNTEWGFKATAKPVFPNIGDAAELRQDIVNAHGLPALVDLVLHIPNMAVRQSAALALTSMAYNESARAAIAKLNCLDQILDLLEGSQGDVRASLLRLLGLLSLDAKNRERVIEFGRLPLVLDMSRSSDPTCVHAAAMAIDDMASDESMFRWKMCGSICDIELDAPVTRPPTCRSSLADASQVCQDDFPVDLPLRVPDDFFMTAGVRVRRGQDWAQANLDGGPGHMGTVTRVDGTSVFVHWDAMADPEATAESIYDTSKGGTKHVVPVQDASGKIIVYHTKQVEIVLDKEVVMGENDTLKVFDWTDMSTAQGEYSPKLGADATLQPGKSIAVRVMRGFRLQYKLHESSERDPSFKWKAYVVPLFNNASDDERGLGLHEAALELVFGLLNSENAATRAVAASAVGKLGKPLKASSSGGEDEFVQSPYRDHIVSNPQALLGLLDHMDEPAANNALTRLVPTMDQLLQVVPIIPPALADNPKVSRWIAMSYYKCVKHNLRATQLNGRVLSTPRFPQPFAAALEGRELKADFRAADALGFFWQFDEASRFNKGENSESSDHLYVYDAPEREYVRHSYDADAVAEAAANSADVEESCVFSSPGVFLKFEPQRASGNAKGGMDAAGFSLTVAAKMADWEHCDGLSQYIVGDQLGVDEPRFFQFPIGMGTIITILPGSLTHPDDKLSFYEDEECTDELWSVSGVCGGESIWLDGTLKVYYKFQAVAENPPPNGRIGFRAASWTVGNAASDSNIATLLTKPASMGTPAGGSSSAARQPKSEDGIKVLMQVARSGDVDTQRYAALAFAQLCLHQKSRLAAHAEAGDDGDEESKDGGAGGADGGKGGAGGDGEGKEGEGKEGEGKEGENKEGEGEGKEGEGKEGDESGGGDKGGAGGDKGGAGGDGEAKEGEGEGGAGGGGAKGKGARGDVAYALDRMQAVGGMSVASTLSLSEDYVVRHAGTVALAQFSTTPASAQAMVAEGAWKPLMARGAQATTEFLTTSVDVDTRRHAAWALYNLSLQASNHEEMAACGVFTPLVSCLGSRDKLTKFYAASALFELASGDKNRDKLLETGLDFLVDTATSPVTATDPETRAEELALQEGAAVVLCKLACSRGPGLVTAMQSKLSAALALTLSNVVRELEEQASSGGAAGAGSTNNDKVFLCVRTFRRVANKAIRRGTADLSELLSEQEQEWASVLEKAGDLLKYGGNARGGGAGGSGGKKAGGKKAAAGGKKSGDDSAAAAAADAGGENLGLRARMDNKSFERIRSHLIDGLSAFLKADSDTLQLAAATALIKVAGNNWADEGEGIFATLSSTVTNHVEWVRNIPRKKKTEFDELLDSSCLLFEHLDFADGTWVVLNFLTAFCSLNGEAERPNQEKILSLLEARYIEREQRYSDDVPHPSMQFFFKKNETGELYLSSTSGARSKVWRDLSMFYRYEPRQNVIRFLNCSLNLWSQLCLGANQPAIRFFRSRLSFEQLVECCFWRFSEHEKLRQQCTTYVSLLLNLYVNVNPTRLARGIEHDKMYDTGDNFSQHSKAELSLEQRKMVKRYIDVFMGYGDVSALGQADSLGQMFSSKTAPWEFVHQMLDLSQAMLDYGYYMDPAVLSHMQAALLNSLEGAFPKKPVPHMLQCKVKVLRLLGSTYNVALDLQLSESVRLFRRYSFAMEDGSAGEGGAEVIRRELDSGAYPRLRDMIDSQSADHPDVLNDEHVNAVLLALSVNAPDNIGSLALELLARIRSTLQLYHEHVRELCLLNTEAEASFKALARLAGEIRGVTLDDGMAASRRGAVERALLAMTRIVEGRTEGVELDVGARVIRGPNWQHGDEDGGEGNLGTVVEMFAFSGVPRAAVKVDWDNCDPVETRYRFGYKGLFDVAAAPEVPAHFVNQSIARSLGVHDMVLAILKQESAHRDSAEMSGLFQGCYQLLTAMARNHEPNRDLFVTRKYTDVFASQLGNSYGIAGLLTTVFSGNASAYASVTPYLVDEIVSAVQVCIASGSANDAGTRFIRLLNAILPDSAQPSAQLRNTQNLIAVFTAQRTPNVPGVDAKAPLLQQTLQAVVDDSDIIDKPNGMGHCRLALIQLVARCCRDNDTARGIFNELTLAVQQPQQGEAVAATGGADGGALVAAEPEKPRHIFAPLRVVETLHDLRHKYNGYLARATMAMPWMFVMDSLHMQGLWMKELRGTTSAEGVAALKKSGTVTALQTLQEMVLEDMQRYDRPAIKETSMKQEMVESAHPYNDNANQVWPVRIGGAKRLKVVFDAATATETRYDYVEFFADAECQDKVAGPFSGGRGGSTKNFPGLNGAGPCVVQGDHFFVKFVSDASNTDWGFKLFVRECLDHEFPDAWPVPEMYDSMAEGAPDAAKWESPHPYSDNMDETRLIEVTPGEGDTGMLIYFSSKSSTEQNYDYLTFSDPDNSDCVYGAAKICGGRGGGSKNFPGCEEREPLYVPGFRVNARFRSDGSNNDWGFKFVAVPGKDDFAELPAGVQHSVQLESEHPYGNSLDEKHHLELPEGTENMAVAFHPGSSTEHNYDYLQFFTDADCTQRVGAEKYSGGRGGSSKNFPTKEAPLIVPGRECWVKWVTDSSNVDFGWKLIAWPARDPMAEFKVDGHVVLESSHEYENSLDHYEEVSIEGAECLCVVFDPTSSTELNYDYIKFYKNDEHEEQWGEDKYHGGRGGSTKNFPGFEGREPLIIPAGSFVLHFHTDSSNTDWGYKMIVCDAAKTSLGSADDDEEAGADGEGVAESKEDDGPLEPVDIFPFFRNATDDAATVMLDLPVKGSGGYFEAFLSGEGNVHLGWACKGAEPNGQATTADNEDDNDVAIGLGSDDKSYAIDGAAGDDTRSHSYTGGNATALADFKWRAGLVVGCYVDLTGGKMSMKYVVDGQVVTAFEDTSPIGAWRKGVKPAFTLAPGQGVSINYGQSPFLVDDALSTEQNFQSVLQARARGTGKALAWQKGWATWEPLATYHKLWEEANSPAIGQYQTVLQRVWGELTSLTRLLRFEASAPPASGPSGVEMVAVGGGAARQTMAPGARTRSIRFDTTIPTLVRKMPNFLEDLGAVMEDAVDGTLQRMGVWYSEEDLRGVSEEDKFLERPDESVGGDFDDKVADLSLAHLVRLFRGPFEATCDLEAGSSGGGSAESAQLDAMDSGAAGQSGLSIANLSSVTDALGGLSKVGFDLLNNKVGDMMAYTALTDSEVGGHSGGAGGAASKEDAAASSMSALASERDQAGMSAKDAANFKLVVSTVMRGDQTERALAKAVLQMFRALGENFPEHKYAIKDRRRTKASEVDTRTVKVVQDTMNKLDCTALVCNLIGSAVGPVVQDEAFQLGSFMLENLNRDVQSEFLAVMSGEHSAYAHGERVVQAIGSFITKFQEDFPGLRGRARLVRAERMRHILEFLQQLCEGQKRDMQEFLATDSAWQAQQEEIEASGKPARPGQLLRRSDIMTNTVYLLLGLYYDTAQRTKWSENLEDKSFVISLTNQVVETLADFIQGPSKMCQDTLVAAGVFEAVARWSEVINAQTREVTKKLGETGLLPRLTDAQPKAELYEHPLWQFYRDLRSFESNLMVLVFSVLEGNMEKEVIESMLKHLEATVFINQFSRHWHSARFNAGVARRVHARSNELQTLIERGEAAQADQAAGRESSERNRITPRDVKALQGKAMHVSKTQAMMDTALGCFKSTSDMLTAACRSNQQAEAGLQGESLKLFLTIARETLAQHQQLMKDTRMDLAHSRDDTEFSVTIAFNYYVTVETLVETGDDMSIGIDVEARNQLLNWKNLWSPHRKSESTTLAKYFGRIEVQIDDSLQRIYFPIPPDCREQMRNPLVKKEQDKLLELVNRENPEEKLDDFVERIEGIKAVIRHQQHIRNKSRFKNIISFLSNHETAWVAITFTITCIINVILLSTVSARYQVDNNYLDDNSAETVQFLGVLHVLFTIVLILNYCIGTAQITVNRGRAWRKELAQDEEMQQPGLRTAAFKLADTFVHWLMWDIFYLVMDFWTFYYLVFGTCSVLGLTYNSSYFAFHTLDVAARIRLLNYVLKSVTANIGQVLATLFLGTLLCYIYAVVSYNSWGWAQYNYGDGCEVCGDWTTLYESFMMHLDFGLRGAPIFEPDSAGEYSISMYLFDISYNLLIILIMVAMITGIIIDTFADMRTANNEIEDDTRNNCFICSISREVFERKKIIFQTHIKQDHYMWGYMYYSMYLESGDYIETGKKQSEFTGTERNLYDKIRGQDTSYFPIGKALCLSAGDDEADEIAELKDEVSNVEEVVQEVKAAAEADSERITALADVVNAVNTKLDALTTHVVEMKSSSTRKR